MSWSLVFLLAAALKAPVAVDALLRPSADSCPITRPSLPLVPPAPYPIVPSGETFWHGTAAFWTMLDASGRWSFPNRADVLGQKVFWWRPGFNGAIENYPDLTVTLRSLDTGEMTIVTRKATNAHHESFGGWAMLTGIGIPSEGCWEITGEHRGHSVSFTVWVGR